MPQGVCVKPQRRTASAFSAAERFSAALARSGGRPNARRTTFTPQYIACVPPAGDVAPAHALLTAWSAEPSDVGETFATGAAKPRTIAVRDWAIPMRGRWN